MWWNSLRKPSLCIQTSCAPLFRMMSPYLIFRWFGQLITCWFFFIISFLFVRLQPGTSYFDTLPQNIDDTTADYAPLCSGQASFHVPTFIKRRKTTFTLCNLIKKREVYYSDELTAEDYELFKKLPPSENRHRFGRASPATVIPLKNATNYCVERIANSKVGKICANQGVDVQSFVDSCSLDISVGTK